MPAWKGRWKGGRYYLNPDGKRVFVIERRVNGQVRAIKLKTHDEDLAVGELARFVADPVVFVRKATPGGTEPVYITRERLTLYLDMLKLKGRVHDHRAARLAHLMDWGEKNIDLRHADKTHLRALLAEFEGGHRGRVESLNAFARWLVREGDLTMWTAFENTQPVRETRGAREAYSLEDLEECRQRLTNTRIRACFILRAETGMHQTEIDQIAGVRVYNGPLPDKGTGLRILPPGHEIKAVLQVQHKSKHRHRQPLSATGLEAAKILIGGVPYRVQVWEAMAPIIPSNLRHTFVTLAGECGERVTYIATGLDRSVVAQAVGHRAGSTMTADKYEKMQVPPMIRLPLAWLEPRPVVI